MKEAARPVVERAFEQDAEELWRLRTVLEDWLEQQGIVQWDKGELSKLQLLDQVSRGEWHLTRDGSAICAALRFLWADPLTWGKLDGFAGYVHGLMVDRNHAGQGLGRRLLSWAEEQARKARAPLLRLDCVETNTRLRSYYVEQDFREVGRQDFGGRWRSVVLMEKSLC